MNSRRPPPVPLAHDTIALVLQGGGALGAYQAGVYEEIAAVDVPLHWVAGVSIGAINAALIAGNPPARRVERLREFWTRVSADLAGFMPLWDAQRAAFHQWSSLVAATAGVSGFYRPRVVPPALALPGTPQALSLYDTAPLRETLLRLVDFDLINRQPMRLSVGAVNVRTGNSIYFDNTRQRIGVEHILASGALPPAFAPVEIGGEHYWDGGIVSNTPLQYVLDEREAGRMLVAQVDLFSARGELPTTFGEVLSRHKDILYSSRTRFNTDQAARARRERRAIRDLLDRLPASMRDDPQVRALREHCAQGHVDIVHLILRQGRWEQDSKDYEFSRSTVLERWAQGQRDMRHTIEHPDLLRRTDHDEAVSVYDLAHKNGG